MKRQIVHVWLICLAAFAMPAKAQQERPVWSKEQAWKWHKQTPWMAGANFYPATAINQLEMWQAESFDTATISRDLGYAAGIGMRVMRVYLHHLAWKEDKEGFKQRMKTYLSIADRYNIRTIFVIFDDCWNNTYAAGPQPAPKPGIHNSGWVQDPGKLLHDDPSLMATLEAYTKDVLKTFAKDKRILLWDLYNEPGNSGWGDKSMPLLQNVFRWGRTVNPSQPLSVGVWNFSLKNLTKFQLENSDVITYHDYTDRHLIVADSLLKATGKPLVCTEYMARTRNSHFANSLPGLKERGIIAVNWGLVQGKSNTIYAWDTPMKDGSEPKVWFHDIFRPDGRPYDPSETALIRRLTLGK
ncbi:cellulase family glycosylhydrolase [Chitinophaga sp.]|uniref:cellulase family glycosylhydrolase n=1 Tax=Chitinophaga sp. TaxID=1869181 RepID=UPI0026168A4B|nr:cellulase family glycosylhydrolase [uncultured Chitinophaga sp.]